MCQVRCIGYFVTGPKLTVSNIFNQSVSLGTDFLPFLHGFHSIQAIFISQALPHIGHGRPPPKELCRSTLPFPQKQSRTFLIGGYHIPILQLHHHSQHKAMIKSFRLGLPGSIPPVSKLLNNSLELFSLLSLDIIHGKNVRSPFPAFPPAHGFSSRH